ncbi:hypothetical protein EG328_010624 [Venturia inaequalis]|uniref:Uncharacterized protein n=1 Tax=Venturia inaequalis TaxID=5025 RepID=A0A8H3V672_VENIN|nr:hypothetical protein EG328_010624 [Venturia inaequalis]
MHLQALLPAILFAQSSFASYFCCVQVETIGGGRVSKFIESGHNEVWQARIDCGVDITKSGALGCNQWKAQIVDGWCPSLSPTTNVGVAPAGNCRY